MSQTQVVTAELRRWVSAQAAAGHTPDSVLKAMRASGWDEAVARDALAPLLKGPHDDGDAVGGLGTRPLPGAAISAARPVVDAAGQAVRVLGVVAQPHIVIFGDLLTADECAELIALARSRLARSETVETRSGLSEVNDARTSDGMFFLPGEFPICATLERRIAALLDWPVENGEGLQILRYGPGAEYKPHYDYFDPAEPGTPAILERGGQRVASLVCYLNTPAGGGATTFPEAGVEVGAVQGNAVFFSYDRPQPSTLTLHGGAPVETGEKWVATKWMRERRFE